MKVWKGAWEFLAARYSVYLLLLVQQFTCFYWYTSTDTDGVQAGRPLVPVFGDITIEVASILKMSDAAEEVASKVPSLLALLVQTLSDYLLYCKARRLRARCEVYLLY